MSLTHEDVQAILKIIDESPYDEVRLEIGDLKMHVRRRGDGAAIEPMQSMSLLPNKAALQETRALSAATAPAAGATPSPPSSPAVESSPADGLIAVRAPMLGTFYRASAPGEPAFVETGTQVSAEDTVCLVEVMKLFNSVRAGVAGTVRKIAVENGSMVEYGQTLILIEPDVAVQ